MAANTMASGNKTRCMARASIRGTTDATTPATTSTIRRRATASSSGPTNEHSGASGKMESRTALASTTTAKVKCATESGPKAGDSSGSKKRTTMIKWRLLKNELEEK